MTLIHSFSSVQTDKSCWSFMNHDVSFRNDLRVYTIKVKYDLSGSIANNRLELQYLSVAFLVASPRIFQRAMNCFWNLSSERYIWRIIHSVDFFLNPFANLLGRKEAYRIASSNANNRSWTYWWQPFNSRICYWLS